MALIRCTCIWDAEVRGVVLADPTCPAREVHARTATDDLVRQSHES